MLPNGSDKLKLRNKSLLALTYSRRPGSYQFRVHLAPYATANLDVKELIANQSRDENGHTLPVDVQEGSFVFHSAKDVHAPMSLDVNVGIYNVAKGTCYYGSVSCDGYYGGLIVSPATSSVAASGDWVEQLSAYGHYSDGSTPGVSPSWSSSNGSIATVDSNGNVAGVIAGNVTLTATASLPEEGEFSGYNPSCASLQPYVNFTGTATVSVGDLTPIISGIFPSDWISGTTVSVTFSGQNFGSNVPTLTFLQPNGISYTLTSYNDSQIVATITVAAGTPTEDLIVYITNNGYNGQGFLSNGNGQSARGQAPASVHLPIKAPEITAVAWIQQSTIKLPSGENSQLQSDLSAGLSCAIDVSAWALSNARDLQTPADRAYAAAFLLWNSANSAPPPTINAVNFAKNPYSYRLINDFGGPGSQGGPGGRR